ncbi:hypothetical protein T440DRAFT_470805 [Plenodomus tracheiphilus IPT5]|uniref:Mus7/MMS22 family-domain-containing protein n=1 Tax=Plenodomus tracheiphilus IPT5 TaxID=1408161 RepID=A0A6A7AXG4_9PLEO|nr:hypothetical protein T440DRAFT_470805 [Plenodomus tracheiphilus IPT5]
MSIWRQKGFVQDSDDEDGSQIESQYSKQHADLGGRVERDGKVEESGDETKGGIYDNEKITCSGLQGVETLGKSTGQKERDATPTRHISQHRPTPSPITPISTLDFRPEATQSPDPLQISPFPKFQRNTTNVPSQLLGSPASVGDISLSEPKRDNTSSQILGETVTIPLSNLPAVGNDTAADILSEFGIAPLSDDSDDDALSDPPSDLESPPTHVAFGEPHRRTAVQVVIPSSTALQQHLAEQASRREFRQRKPIQLHPYALEGELYRREVQSRGLKPVARARSPQRQITGNDGESQEKDFDPHEAPSSSPPELEIPVSTSAVSRPRSHVAQGSSSRRSASNATPRLPPTQLRLPPAAKRRRLESSSLQPVSELARTSEESPVPRNIWDIPPNSPPYSSSPLLPGNSNSRQLDCPRLTTPAPSLPTPSTSSVFQDDVRPPEVDKPDPVPRTAPRSGGGLRRPVRIVLSDDSSSASETSSEPEDNELRKVSRKIKGVLPASWLRFDKQTQERRKAQERERAQSLMNTLQSPEPAEPQRGIAQRVTRPTSRPRRPSASGPRPDNVLMISDESDDEPMAHGEQQAREVQHSAEVASALAAMLDVRYAEDNLSDMEDDRLHLPTLGGGHAKRKRQPKITDALGGVKRRRKYNGLTIPSAAGKHIYDDRPRKKKQHLTSLRRTTLPALSVVDIDLSPTKHSGNVPQFLKVARRQALRRPDLARQSPNTKQIRLHNARDTEEANLTLRNWHEGLFKPGAVATAGRHTARLPLAQRSDNKQASHSQSRTDASSVKSFDNRSKVVSELSRARKRKAVAQGLSIFTRTRTPGSQSSQHHRKPSKALQRKAPAIAAPFRTGQLEGDEKDFGHDYRKTAFEKGLRRVDQQFDVLLPQERSYANPQLARFLADDDAVLLSVPTSADAGELDAGSTTKLRQASKKRLVRKRPAQRIDVDTREYRQPSEPAMQEILEAVAPSPNQDNEHDNESFILRGLGPHGTRYPITFEVYSLASETYFHSSTFVGSDEFRRALEIGKPDGRNLDESAGYCTFTQGALRARFGPWDDETCSQIQHLAKSVFAPFEMHLTISEEFVPTCEDAVNNATLFLRTLISYISEHVSFLDPVDRRGFVERMAHIIEDLFGSICTARDAFSLRQTSAHNEWNRKSVRVMAYLLVIATQIHQIGQHPIVDLNGRVSTTTLIKSISRTIVVQLVERGIPELSVFLEGNKRHAVREGGIQDSDMLVECTVLCMKTLENIAFPKCGFWEILGAELSSTLVKANHVTSFEATWATIYTLLPFSEIDISGIPSRSRHGVQAEDWTCIRVLLKRLYELYPTTSRRHGTLINEFVWTNLARCHRLIKYWHWEHPEHMLNATFDFFGKNGLRQLRHEASRGSVAFLDNLAIEHSLSLNPNETAFHVALKCLALGLQGMGKSYAEKKIRSFVFRTIPNHGRAYPKDQPLDEESLAALRNHHDLLSVLYWAAPASCRPKLDHIRHLVSHETSHREACRLNVRAWANLTEFQLSTEEPYVVTKPFALWFMDIMHQSLKQYRLAKTEADDYIKSGVLDGTTDVSAAMVRQTMERNQEQVIATLRDCIAGTRKAIQTAKDPVSLAAFLGDSDIVRLLELPHLEDRRLINVIRDALAVFRDYSAMQTVSSSHEESQTTSEESQDYGDFPDLDDFDDRPPPETATRPGLDFIQTPLWHLLSNAFGADCAPDDNLLMDCVDTWVHIARAQVTSGQRTWSYYIDSYSATSWVQLRQTEQTRKFRPYYLAALIDSSPSVYEEHRHEFIQAMLLSLAERESMLRFQHRLLAAILRTDRHHPLLQNLPYIRKHGTNDFDVSAETLRNRRLALISSVLSNMRDDIQATTRSDPASASQLKRTYATMLKEFMTTMKFNYQQLQQGANVTGAYVEFVQKIVQFLKQYTNDICPVISFFTDSVAFPLPAGDPTYVVARLCGYAPKLADPGTAKQLSVFIQTVAQQAAADNHQSYLVNQLTTALCTDEAPAMDRESLRNTLLQGVFPVYLEEAYSSNTSFLVAQPILRALPRILDSMIFDLRIMQPASLSSTVGSILSISHAFIRGTECIKDNPYIFRQPHVLSALSYMFEAMTSITPLLDYICSRLATSIGPQPSIIVYMEELTTFVTEMLQDMLPSTMPIFEGNAHTPSADRSFNDLLAFCKRGLQDGLNTNWREHQGVIWFGQGQARREVLFDIGLVEEERAKLEHAIEWFEHILHNLYKEQEEGAGIEERRFTVDDLVV